MKHTASYECLAAGQDWPGDRITTELQGLQDAGPLTLSALLRDLPAMVPGHRYDVTVEEIKDVAR